MVSLILIILLLVLTTREQMTVNINEEVGYDHPSCLRSTTSSCKTIEFIAGLLNAEVGESIRIQIAQPGIKLSQVITFENYTGLSIEGDNPVTIQCDSAGAGLSFINVSNIFLNNINMKACGAEKNISLEGHVNVTEVSSIYFSNCRNINIVNSVVQESNGTGISMLNAYNEVYIENLRVQGSSLDSLAGFMYGDNGLAINFSPKFVDRKNNAMYTINNCTFSENNASASQDIAKQFSHSWHNTGCMGTGGGLCLSLGANSTFIDVTIENCSVSNNSAMLYGGGSKVQTLDTSHDNQVQVRGSNFSRNNALGGKMGGGLEIIFSFYAHDLETYQRHVKNTTISFERCQFDENFAKNGGGLNIFTGEAGDNASMISFTHCSWNRNSASLYGSAVHVQPSVWASRNPGQYPNISFFNCSFTNNMLKQQTKSHVNNYTTRQNGAGAFVSNFVQVEFCGVTNFTGNNGSGLYLITSVTIFCANSEVLFESNSGINGGAILMGGRSFLYTDESCIFVFINNYARDLGGAIFFHSESKDNQPCFIYRGLHNTKSNFTFTNNTAGLGIANHIFASSFTSCNLFCPNLTAYECIGNFSFKHNKSSTASLPATFVLNTTHQIMLFPGLQAKLPLIVKDPEGNSVLNVSYQANVVENYENVQVDAAFSHVSANTIIVVGNEGEKATLELDDLTDGVSILFDITLDTCPPGYTLNLKHKCECSTSYYGLINCDPVLLLFGMWVGKYMNNNKTSYCTSDCPIGFCTFNHSNGHKLQFSHNMSQLESIICSDTRKGTRCGECIPGHSVYYNSPTFKCGSNKQCSLGALYFTLYTVFPMAILLILITIFDTNFANGWSSFIFFSQIVSVLYIRGYGFPDAHSVALSWILPVYNFFNLELFNQEKFAFCIWEGANSMVILMIRLGSIVIALLLVLGILFILMREKVSRILPRIFLRRRFSIINSISAFLMLCYALCAKTCFQVFYTSCLFDERGSCLNAVVFYSADMTPFHGRHINYAVIALVFLFVIVILPPALLIFYPLFFKLLGMMNLSESKFATYLWRLMPIQLLDSLQNSLKDSYRFFAGLFFLYRTVPLVLYAVTKKMTQVYMFTEFSLITMIAVHAAFQPYKKHIHNTIDLLLLFNLALINGISVYTFTNVMIGIHNDLFWISTVQLILLLLPLCIAVLVLLSKLYVWFNKRNTFPSPHLKSINRTFNDSFRSRDD